MTETTWGCALRPHHFAHWQKVHAFPDILEIHADQFIGSENLHSMDYLRQYSHRSDVTFHCTGMNIGGNDAVSEAYLNELRLLIREFEPILVSDHLGISKGSSHNSYDLLSIPFNKYSFNQVADKISRIQDSLACRLAIENVCSFLNFKESDRSEFEFLRDLCEKTGCGVLIDVNNLFIDSANFGLNPKQQLAFLKPESILQYHVGGHTRRDEFLVDSHDRPVCREVWELLKHAHNQVAVAPVVLERDDETTPLVEVLMELALGRTWLSHSSLGPTTLTPVPFGARRTFN